MAKKSSLYKTLPFDLVAIGQAFGIVQKQNCSHLDTWLAAEYELNVVEQTVLTDLHTDVSQTSGAMNEEELKARLVGLLFYAARIDVPNKIRVFYERPISAIIDGYNLGVICDCMVATPMFSLPVQPYFFLQEFKKAKGEKKDPEAQMLMAMLISQHLNNDNKPVYGGYLIGDVCHFTTLIGKDYCVSRPFYAGRKDDLFKMASILRKLQDLILNR
jgi:hypothetical protein